jgi:hypothetical protein
MLPAQARQKGGSQSQSIVGIDTQQRLVNTLPLPAATRLFAIQGLATM